MYPSSASSSSHCSMPSSGLIRYGSAPGSLLTSAIDSLVSTDREFSPLGSHHLISHHYFPAGDSSSESTCKVPPPPDHKDAGAGDPAAMLQRSYGFSEMPVADFSTATSLKGSGGGGGGGSAPSLIRHSSSPAGFFNQLTVENRTLIAFCFFKNER